MNKLEKTIVDAARKTITRPYLVIFPASGVIRRLMGKFIHVDAGGDAKWMPIIVMGSKACTLDPRCLVVRENDLTKIEYHPRQNMHRMIDSCVEWLEKNPDVFTEGLENGFTQITTEEEN